MKEKDKKVGHDSKGFVTWEKGEHPADWDSESEKFKKAFPYDTTPEERKRRLKQIREARDRFEAYKRNLGSQPLIEEEEKTPITSEEQEESYSEIEEERKGRRKTRIEQLDADKKEYLDRLLLDSLKKPNELRKDESPMNLKQIRSHFEKYFKEKISYKTLRQYRKKLKNKTSGIAD